MSTARGLKSHTGHLRIPDLRTEKIMARLMMCMDHRMRRLGS